MGIKNHISDLSQRTVKLIRLGYYIQVRKYKGMYIKQFDIKFKKEKKKKTR